MFYPTVPDLNFFGQKNVEFVAKEALSVRSMDGHLSQFSSDQQCDDIGNLNKDPTARSIFDSTYNYPSKYNDYYKQLYTEAIKIFTKASENLKEKHSSLNRTFKTGG